LDNFICTTCGAQYEATSEPPQECLICIDERQYIGWDGQQWTTLAQMRRNGYRNQMHEIDPGIWGIATEPRFAIGQRSLLVRTEAGNILWDCVSFLDAKSVSQIKELGGVAAIACSHPHFYTGMAEWSHVFDGAPIYIPSADKEWVTRLDPAIRLWHDRVELLPGLTLLQCGGHFPGSSVLHWAQGAEGKGALLTGDTVMVAQDRRSVSFMYSFPNLIPLGPSAIHGILEVLGPFDYERIYSGWWGKNIEAGGKEAVRSSAERYLNRILVRPQQVAS